MRLFIQGSVAYDEIGHFRGSFREVIRPELMEKLSVSFIVEDHQRHFGGCAGNMAYGLGLLGVPAYLCTRVGKDGKDYEERLKGLGMHLDYLEEAEGWTARAVVTSDREGAQVAHFSPGVIGREAPSFLFPGCAEGGDVLVVGPENHDRMLEAFREAERRGMRIFFDPGQLIHTFSREELMEVLEKAEALFVNDYEWGLLQEKISLSSQELAETIPVIFLTQGEKGVRLFERGSTQDFEAPPVKCLDATGAGDAFRAGVLAGVYRGLPFPTCAQMGVLMGSVSVTVATPQDYSLHSDLRAQLKMLGCVPEGSQGHIEEIS